MLLSDVVRLPFTLVLFAMSRRVPPLHLARFAVLRIATVRAGQADG